MKKRIMALLFALMLLVVTGCDSEDISEPSEVWTYFSNALKETEQLAFYDIVENHTIDGKKTTVRLVLTNDDMGRVVARKTTEAGDLWWFQGLTYDGTGAEKIKYAQGIDTFLNISRHKQTWEYSSARDVQMDNGIITFSIEEDGRSCHVTAEVEGKFIERIAVEIIRQGEETPEIIEYVYTKPGQKPDVVLPEDLNDYHY